MAWRQDAILAKGLIRSEHRRAPANAGPDALLNTVRSVTAHATDRAPLQTIPDEFFGREKVIVNLKGEH